MEKCYLFHQIDVWQNGTELLEDERDTELVERGAKREGGRKKERSREREGGKKRERWREEKMKCY